MNDAQLFSHLSELLEARKSVALATVIATKGSVPREVGARMVIESSGETVGTIGGGKFESLVIDEALELLRNGDAKPKTCDYPLHEDSNESIGAVCGGTITIFIEPMGLSPRLVCVGAGHCSRALSAAAHLLGWRIEIIEDRSTNLKNSYFPENSSLIKKENIAEYMTELSLDRSTAVALLNRNYMLDRDCLEQLLIRRRDNEDNFPFYLGMIGSDRKVGKVSEELGEKGFSKEELEIAFAPIGLDIEADTPEEIAVSILAEIVREYRTLDFTKS